MNDNDIESLLELCRNLFDENSVKIKDLKIVSWETPSGELVIYTPYARIAEILKKVSCIKNLPSEKIESIQSSHPGNEEVN